MADNRVKLVGQVFGELTVIKKVYVITKGDNSIPKWEVICSCGKIDVATTYQLKSKNPRKRLCEDCARRRPRKDKQDKGLKSEHHNYRHNALNKGLNFEITLGDFSELITKSCEYCGKEPLPRGKHKALMNGLDRVDNSLGYLLTNVVPCCTVCNMMKKGLTKLEFLSHINDVYYFNKERR